MEIDFLKNQKSDRKTTYLASILKLPYFSINAFEQVNKTSTMDTIAKNYIVNQETGKFYVLLPAGQPIPQYSDLYGILPVLHPAWRQAYGDNLPEKGSPLNNFYRKILWSPESDPGQAC